MAKKTKQRGDVAAAREASDPEGMTAAAAGSGASKKSRRRGDAAEVEKETAASLADSAMERTPEKKHKIKKPKKSKQQQTEAVSGIGVIDSHDVKIVEEAMNAKEGNNDDSQNYSSVQENSVGKKKKKGSKKRKINTGNTDRSSLQSSALLPDAGEAPLVTTADESSIPDVNIAEDSMNGKQGIEHDSHHYSSTQENSVQRKKKRKRKQQMINDSTTDSNSVQNSSLQPDAGEAALVTTAAENSIPVVNIAEDSMNGKQGNKNDSPNCSSVQENSVGRKKKKGSKKRKINNSNTDTNTVQNCSLQSDAGEAALVTAADENSNHAVNIAEDSMNGEQGNKDDSQNYSSLQENSAGRKKERRRKTQKINNSNTDSSTVRNSSLRPDAAEAALVTTADENSIPVLNIAEDSMNGKQGNKDDPQNYSSLQENSVGRKKKMRRKKQKKINSNTDADTVQNCSLQPDAGEAALVTAADENSIPDVNIAEDSMNGEQGNKDDPQNYSSLQENSAGRKKERKRKNQKINNSNTDSSTVQNSSLRPDAGEAALVTTAESNIPVVNIAEDPMNGKQGNKDDSQNYSSLQNSVRSKKKKKRKNQKENNSNTDASTVQSSPLQPDAGEAALVTTADENITPYISIAEDSMNGKQDSKDDSQHHSSSQENSVQRKIKPRRKKQSINNINTDRNSVQNSPLQPDAGEAALETAGENSIECSKSTESNKSIKINQDGVTAKAKINVLHEKLVACESTAHDTACTGPLSLDQVHKHKEAYSLGGSMIRFRKKKLLILDLNGLLADINQDHHNAHMSHAKVRGKLVFKRPYYEDFLKFCFQNFELGVWSSRMKYNVETVVNVLMKDLKKYLLFCWDLSYCTPTGCNTLENQHKPLVLKELKKLWNKEVPDLPWEQGEISPSNTLLVDDSPYKALRNPLHTAVFPRPYSYHNEKDDDSLGPGGDLRVYLENLAAADDVQHYVREPVWSTCHCRD